MAKFALTLLALSRMPSSLKRVQPACARRLLLRCIFLLPEPVGAAFIPPISVRPSVLPHSLDLSLSLSLLFHSQWSYGGTICQKPIYSNPYFYTKYSILAEKLASLRCRSAQQTFQLEKGAAPPYDPLLEAFGLTVCHITDHQVAPDMFLRKLLLYQRRCSPLI